MASAELKERMRYVKREEEKRLKENGQSGKRGKDAAAELYENMCMNAVNQSIGKLGAYRFISSQDYYYNRSRNPSPQ